MKPDAAPAEMPDPRGPIGIDRFLDGELAPAERQALEGALRTDAELRAVVDRRERFLSALESAGLHDREDRLAAMPNGLDHRIRFALRGAGRQRAPLRWATSRWATSRLATVAAIAVLALGAALWFDDGSDAQAMPNEVIMAAEAARAPDPGPRGCTERGGTSPVHFPPVRDGSLHIWRCAKGGNGTVAKLYRLEEAPSIGYAAIPEPGAGSGPVIGRTDLGDVVVFDLAYGAQRHYLAVAKTFLTHHRKLTPGRESCRACHNESRKGKKNPHNIVERSWRLGG